MSDRARGDSESPLVLLKEIIMSRKNRKPTRPAILRKNRPEGGNSAQRSVEADTANLVSSSKNERCPKCQSSEFAIAADPSQKRYCNKCRNVWLPKTAAEIELDYAEEELVKLRVENNFLRDRVRDLEESIGVDNSSQQASDNSSQQENILD